MYRECSRKSARTEGAKAWSFSSEGYEQIPRTGLWQFAHFADRPNILQMHRFDPTCPQHRLNLEPPLANKAPTWAQPGPT